jgi:hypothetical protein
MAAKLHIIFDLQQFSCEKALVGKKKIWTFIKLYEEFIVLLQPKRLKKREYGNNDIQVRPDVSAGRRQNRVQTPDDRRREHQPV